MQRDILWRVGSCVEILNVFEHIWISPLQPPRPPLRFTARAAEGGFLLRSSRSSWSPGQIWEQVDQFTFKANIHVHLAYIIFIIYTSTFTCIHKMYMYRIIVSYHFISYHIISCHIISYHSISICAFFACNSQILLVIKIQPVLSLCVKALPSIARTVWLLRCHPDPIHSHNKGLFPLGELARALPGLWQSKQLGILRGPKRMVWKSLKVDAP